MLQFKKLRVILRHLSAEAVRLGCLAGALADDGHTSAGSLAGIAIRLAVGTAHRSVDLRGQIITTSHLFYINIEARRLFQDDVCVSG